MAQRSIQGNQELAKKIKARRNELCLTIEEAASRAGVGSKTWSRYEAGNSIRIDKCKGICRALNWNTFPGEDDFGKKIFSMNKYKEHEAWSSFLEKNFGVNAAIAFVIGSDILLDQIQEDIVEISSKPAGTHLGELDMSYLNVELPGQFLLYYDYDFLYHMKCILNQMRQRAKLGYSMIANSVIEEIIFYLCNEEASAFFELSEDNLKKNNDENDFNIKNWIFDLFGDMDIITCLYSETYLDNDHLYHFSHWFENQFYTESKDNVV